MKKIFPFLVLTIIALSTSGCQYIFMIAAANEYFNMRQELAAKESENLLELDGAEYGFEAKTQFLQIDCFPLVGSKLNLDSLKIIVQEQLSAEDADAAAIMSINQALSAAEEAQLLDVKFSMSCEPTEKGFLVLSIESAEVKTLDLDVLDNEGFSMYYPITLNIKEGLTYLGLDSKNLTDEQYLFRLVDKSSGEELIRSVNITK